MTDPRLALAVGFAAATLALFLAVIAVGGALRRGLRRLKYAHFSNGEHLINIVAE